MSNKEIYAAKCFGLPVEQIKSYDELTLEQLKEVYYHFGRDKDINCKFMYAVKKNGQLVSKRERVGLNGEINGPIS